MTLRELFAIAVQPRIVLALPEKGYEITRLPVCAAKQAELEHYDAPARNGERQKNEQNKLYDRSGIEDHIERAVSRTLIRRGEIRSGIGDSCQKL